ncbi:MAG TPA: sortase [Anaerolineales bacterium]|nr:sortase [Anaerolineales bacterium]
MHKTFNSLLVVGLLVTMFMTPQTAHAQISFPAEMNKAFSPTSIASGAKSRLSVTIFNPNSFALTNATWTDNLPVGITVANPANISNSCGGTVTAVPGGTSFSLSGGTVPAQVGATPSSCTVAIDVTSSTPGNLVNTIPAGSLSTANNVTTTSPASATLNVVGSQPPTVSKSFSPSTIWAGQTSRLTITIRNNDSATTLNDATLTDQLPTNVFLANPVSPTLSGCGGGTLTAVSGGTSVELNGATIVANSTCTIQVNVTSNVQGAYTNTIPAGALDTNENLTNAIPATAVLNVDLIRITKAFIPLTISPGGTSTLIITLQNPTGSPYTGVNVTDNLPSPLTVAGAASSTCIPPGTVSTTSTSVTLAGGIIPAGSILTPGTCTISVPVTIPAGTPSGIFRNVIGVNDVSTDQIGIPRPAVADLRVAGSEVRGTKRFIPNSITAGGNSRLRIEITAPGDTNLTNFSITDDLPAGVTVSNFSPPTISAGCGPTAALDAPTGANSITLTSDLILLGALCMIEVSVTSSVTGTHTNTIAPGDITNSENRTISASFSSNLTVTGAGNLAIDIVKDFNPLLVAGGASSTMSILLINPESVPLTGISFTDNMPIGMILANPVNPNVGACGGTLTGTAGSNSFSFSGGSLPAGGTCTLTLSATITVNGNLTNTIPAGAVTTIEGATNPDPTSATLTNLPGASIGKFFAPNPIAAGSFSLLTITIQNTGSIPLTGMGLADNLPAGLVVAGAPAPVNNCGGTFTAAAGASTVQLTNGVLAGNSSCTIVVSVTGGTPGDYQNTIPAGALITDPALNTTNTTPATATLTITGNPGGGGGGGGGGNRTDDAAAPVASSFLIPLTGFAPGRETKLVDSPHSVYESTSLLLDIPVLKVKAPIVGVESRNGRWDVSWLQQVGWLSGSAYPTWKGNSLLTGHVVNADGKPGLFSKLKFLGVGEYVFVYNAGYRYTYQVVSNGFVQPNDSRVMKHEEKSYLTLITCDTYDERTGTYLRRVVVRAVLVDVSAVK